MCETIGRTMSAPSRTAPREGRQGAGTPLAGTRHLRRGPAYPRPGTARLTERDRFGRGVGGGPGPRRKGEGWGRGEEGLW
ncbi:hypothetical protein GCM10010249_45360 [Streptomyces roseolilacinus]|uniref:Uncharacterized protein n=1 Tax=Streptomyces roseolilacinus TaxID=66904 RepID=A0A918B3N3_9ACTN|nr:hypothetical protein GCM10010249_45360 [Streptomyces roseolilacinus]